MKTNNFKITDLNDKEINLFELRKEVLGLDETHPRYRKVMLNGNKVVLQLHWSWGYRISVQDDFRNEIGSLNTKAGIWYFKDKDHDDSKDCIPVKLSKIKKNLYYLTKKEASKVEDSSLNGGYSLINGSFYRTYNIVIGDIKDARGKADKLIKRGFKTIIEYNGKSKFLKDGRSPRKGYKNSYSVLYQ